MLSVVRERETVEHEGIVVEPATWMFVKGAPDVLFPSCTSALKADGTTIPLDNAVTAKLSTLQQDWSNQGQRVLALCRRSLDGLKINTETMSAETIEELMYAQLKKLTLVGLVGIRDPPRLDVPPAIETIRRAGVRVFMVTGDFKLTAIAIARQVGCCSFISVWRVRFLTPEYVAGRNYHPGEDRNPGRYAHVFHLEKVCGCSTSDYQADRG